MAQVIGIEYLKKPGWVRKGAGRDVLDTQWNFVELAATEVKYASTIGKPSFAEIHEWPLLAGSRPGSENLHNSEISAACIWKADPGSEARP